MMIEQYITQADFEKSTKVPIIVYPFETRINLAPYFGSLVKTQLLEKYDQDTVYKKNLHIFTTLDMDMQRYAEEALEQGLAEIDRMRSKRVKKNIQGCLIAIEPQTGYIRAYVGGRSYSKSQFDRVQQASRQPGSVFKPVVYSAAIEASYGGNQITTATLLQDEPYTLHYSNKTWEPKNYDGQYHGIVNLRSALALSMNVATARLAQQVGLQYITDWGQRLGFTKLKPYPSISLGAFEVSPWQVATAYTVFANGGVKTELRSIKKVSDTEGKTMDRSKIHVERVMHPQTAYILTDMMRSVMEHGTAASLKRFGLNRVVAGKTGTTDDRRDAWLVGYTPNLLAVVWVGYDDNSPVGLTGAQGAGPIWARFMVKATRLLPNENFTSPQGVVATQIDPQTGQLATPSCPSTVTELFIQGTEPTQPCYLHTFGYDPNAIVATNEYWNQEQWNGTTSEGTMEPGLEQNTEPQATYIAPTRRGDVYTNYGEDYNMGQFKDPNLDPEQQQKIDSQEEEKRRDDQSDDDEEDEEDEDEDDDGL